MNKKYLAELLSQRTNKSVRESSETIDHIVDLVTNSISRGIPVTIRGFGSFSMRERKSRLVHNQTTGRNQRVPGAMTPHFRPSRTLRRPLHGD